MKDKLEDLVPWVAKLENSLMKPGAEGDREEAERRDHLKKFVSEILIWHLALLN